MAQMFHDRRARDRDVEVLEKLQELSTDPSLKTLISTMIQYMELTHEAIQEMTSHIKLDEEEKIVAKALKEEREKREKIDTEEKNSRIKYNQAFWLFACATLATLIGYSWNEFINIQLRLERYEVNQSTVLNKMTQIDNATTIYRQQSDKKMDKIEKATE